MFQGERRFVCLAERVPPGFPSFFFGTGSTNFFLNLKIVPTSPPPLVLSGGWVGGWLPTPLFRDQERRSKHFGRCFALEEGDPRPTSLYRCGPGARLSSPGAAVQRSLAAELAGTVQDPATEPGTTSVHKGRDFIFFFLCSTTP